MKRFISLLVLGNVLAAALGAQDVFTLLEERTRWELADAYSQVADKFETMGQKARAEEFRREAKAIFPSYPEKPASGPSNLSPQQVNQPVQGVAVDPLTGIPERPQVRQQNIQGQRISRHQFAKMLRGFLNEDINLILTALQDGISINGGPSLKYGDILVPAKDFFTGNDISLLGPSDIFTMESLKVTDPETAGDDVIITIKAVPGAPGASSLSFWKEHQKYVFARNGDTWKLKSIETSDQPY